MQQCQNIYGGHWVLVRHSYNQWHPATDSLAGSDIYGTYDNDPQSLNSWSIQFDNVLESDGSTLFMFSNGDCSEWMVVENNQFNTQFGGGAGIDDKNPDGVDRHIIASHYNINYTAQWYNRDPSTHPEDPWISWAGWWYPHDGTHTSVLYGEASNPYIWGRFLNNYFNVFISLVQFIAFITYSFCSETTHRNRRVFAD